MSCISFVKTTILKLNPDLFSELRDVLFDDLLPLAIVKKEELTQTFLAEKLCDYFEKIEAKTGKPFEVIVEKYITDLDSVVGNRIAKKPRPTKSDPKPEKPRARKYYDETCTLRKINKEYKCGLLDYSRIMFCLYMAIISNNFQEIDDFDLSMKVLDIEQIISALREETALHGKKLKFETEDPYTYDRSTFILLVVMFYYMKSREIVGEY